jgi:hypothetical protein
MSKFVKRARMIAKIRLISNASAIEDAYMALEQFNGLSAEERRGLRKPRIPKPKIIYNPIAIEPMGIKLAYVEGETIQLKHSDSPDWLPLKNEPQIWEQIQTQLSSVKIGGFTKNK